MRPLPVRFRVVGAIAARGGMQEVAVRDLRMPAALMLGAGFARGFMAHPPGLACPLRTLTGIPCPLCGMTTSVTATTHLHLGAAMAANPAGVVAVIIAIGVLFAGAVERVRLPTLLAPVALLAMWCFELARFRVL